MAEHAPLPPSSAKRWTKCPGSIGMGVGILDAGSIYARLGTAAHSLFEMSMMLGLEPTEWLEQEINGFEVDEDMTDAVGHARDFVHSYLAQHPHAVYHLERRVHPGRYINREDIWGTSDLTLENPPELVVTDYKHGAGVMVFVEDNEQLMLYAVGCLIEDMQKHGYQRFTHVRMVIIQPRSFNASGPVREVVVPVQDILDWMRRVVWPAAAATDDPWAVLTAGEHCRFCPAASRCPELAKHNLKTAMGEFVDLDEKKPLRLKSPDPRLLNQEQFAYIVSQIGIIEDWIRAVFAEAQGSLERGRGLPGFKLVAGQSRRYWRDPDAALYHMVHELALPEDAVAPRKVLSAPKVEALLKARKEKEKFALLKPYISKSEPKLSLAPLSDPRPAVNPVAESFANLDEDLLA